MIAGRIRAYEARIRVKLRGPTGHEEAVEGLLDTGFTGALTLPPSVIAALDLNWRSTDSGTLADGSHCQLDLYEAVVLWGRREREIIVAEADATPLIGMWLLYGHEMNMRIYEGGSVTIKKLK